MKKKEILYPKRLERAQQLGRRMRRQGVQGIVYESVRDPGRTNVVVFLENVVEKKDLKHFLGRPHTRLRGHSPSSLLDTDYGLEAVRDLIETAFTGAFT